MAQHKCRESFGSPLEKEQIEVDTTSMGEDKVSDDLEFSFLGFKAQFLCKY